MDKALGRINATIENRTNNAHTTEFACRSR